MSRRVLLKLGAGIAFLVAALFIFLAFATPLLKYDSAACDTASGNYSSELCASENEQASRPLTAYLLICMMFGVTGIVLMVLGFIDYNRESSGQKGPKVLIKCLSCGALDDEDSDFCKKCGARLSPRNTGGLQPSSGQVTSPLRGDILKLHEALKKQRQMPRISKTLFIVAIVALVIGLVDSIFLKDYLVGQSGIEYDQCGDADYERDACNTLSFEVNVINIGAAVMYLIAVLTMVKAAREYKRPPRVPGPTSYTPSEIL